MPAIFGDSSTGKFGDTSYTPVVATGPTVQSVTTLRGGETAVITVDSYDTVSSVIIGGRAVTSFTELTPTTIQVEVSRNAQYGASVNLVVTDANGAGAPFSVTVNPPTGKDFVTLSSTPVWYPGLESPDQLLHNVVTTPGGYTVDIEANGTVVYQAGTPDGEQFQFYSVDASDNYGASSFGIYQKNAVSNNAPVFNTNGYDNDNSYVYGAAVTLSPSLSTAGTPVPTYSISSGSLPSALSLNTSTGVITGTLNQTGSFDFTVRVSNSEGFDEHIVSFTVTAIAPVFDDPAYDHNASYINGQLVSISPQFSTAPQPIASYTVSGGSLPAGLSLNASTGAITGTIAQEGAVNFDITCSNSAGSGTATVSFNVTPALVAPDVTYTVLGNYLQNMSVNIVPVVNEANPAPVYSVQSGSLPSGLSLNTSTGVISGSTATLGQVNVTIRATNSEGFDDNALQFNVLEIQAPLASGSSLMQFEMMGMS